MSETVIPTDSIPEEAHVTSSEGKSADESQLSLEKLNEFLGRDYRDVDTALKSVKETYDFIGKRDDLRQSLEKVMEAKGWDEKTALNNLQNLMSTQEEVTPAPQGQDNNEVSELKKQLAMKDAQYAEDRFFDKNPQYENIKNIIKPLKQSGEFKDLSWDEFKDTDVVKTTFEAFSTANEAQSKKSVVESNPRLGAASDKLTNARVALEAGDSQTARASAVAAVTELIAE